MEQIENISNHNTENEEIDRIIREELVDEFCESYIEVDEDVWLPETYTKFARSIKDFKIRDSDVIVASFPKSGTTWTQEMVWLLANDLDYKGAEVELNSRFPFLEFCTLSNYEKMEKVLGLQTPEDIRNSVEYLNNQKSPRFIKTHLPFSLLPEQIKNATKSCKIIYVMRNPKDTCVSYLHHGRLFRRWKASLEDFSKVFLANKTMYGSFWKHILGYWKHRHSSDFLFIKFEDMKSDLPSVINKVAKFLNKTLTSEQIEHLCKHLSFESMKNNEAVNDHGRLERRRKFNLLLEEGAFIRSGTVGKYKEEMSPDTVRCFDTWIKDNLNGTDFGLHYNYNL